MAQTTISIADEARGTQRQLAGSDGTNIALGVTLFDANGNPGNATQVTYTAAALSTIAVGGTAVNALTAGTIKTGFDLKNPSTATEPLFFNLVGTATTTESGSTFALPIGASYHGTAGTAQALSVNALTTGHVFSAMAN